MISLPGLCLTTGHDGDRARNTALLCRICRSGMLPNRFPDRGRAPEYNTVDATLWYFVADLPLRARRRATPHCAARRSGTGWKRSFGVISRARATISAWIRDDLLYAGQPGVQLTWMDAKVGDWVVTPRIGKPVEINALWHNALRTMAYFADAC